MPSSLRDLDLADAFTIDLAVSSRQYRRPVSELKKYTDLEKITLLLGRGGGGGGGRSSKA